jgi:osmoprotectant transport system permease protein
MSLFIFLQDNLDQTLFLTMEHIWMVGISLLIAMFIGIPLGIVITKNKELARNVLAVANVIMTIPSIALFGLLLPVLAVVGHGLGKVPAVIALVLYSLLPIIRNTYIAIKNVDPALVDAGRGMGMSKWQLLLELEIPLAVPVILAGLKTATVMNIGIAAIAAYVGAGGLGVFIQQGIARSHETMVLAGALAVSLLAVFIELGMGLLEKWVTPKGLKL